MGELDQIDPGASQGPVFFDLGILEARGPVFIIRGANLRPLLSWKLLLSDHSQMVIAVPCDLLWQGVDGQAWSNQGKRFWHNMGVSSPNGVIAL